MVEEATWLVNGQPVASPEVNSELASGGGGPSWRNISVKPRRRRRDWRWWVGLVGRVLVATGLLLLAFVAYQLWGTGIQTRQAQNQLEREFTRALPAATTTSAASATSIVPAAGPSTTAAATTEPAPPPTSLPPGPGDPVARLEAPSIGLDWIVVSGVGVDELKKGPGHYPDTPLPGENGNIGIAGHRTTYGAPFFDIDQLATGDDVIMTASDGGRFVYQVTEQFIVSPSQYDVLAPSDTPILTLTSCHPRYSAQKRIIVRATLDPAQSSPLADPVPATTPPTVAPEATLAPTVTAPPATEASGSASDTSGTAPSTAGVTVPAAVIGGSELERGWFDDPNAWPQVALWGFALVFVSLVAWRVTRRSGHNWIGALAGILPFVVCLYFFFENVNRLLPPNI